MAFLYGHKQSAPGGAQLPRCLHLQLDMHSVVEHLGRKGRYREKFSHGRRPSKLDLVGGGYGARRLVQALLVHQGHRSRPVAMTVEQRSNDSTVDHAGKRLMVGLRHELQLQTALDAVGIDFQAVFVGRPATETNGGWCIGSLNAVITHTNRLVKSIDGSCLRMKTERS